jgi:hypothetical protein
MQVFPQLATGAAAIYPVTRKTSARTIVNSLSDGSTVALADPDALLRQWELSAIGMTAAEWNAVETLFQAVLGRLETFTFLDPAGNLLARSEDFGAPDWNNGPSIQLTGGINDPLGSTGATHVVNTGATSQTIEQVLAVPGDFRYAFSVWARTMAGASLTLLANTTGGTLAQTFALTSQWQRVSMSFNLNRNTSSVAFGAQLPASASVDLFGMQVEAQPGISDYKKTGAGGVYANARFAEDALTVRAQGTDVFDAVIRVVTRG